MTQLLQDWADFESWYYTGIPTHVMFYSPASMRWLADRFGWAVSFSDQSVVIFRKPACPRSDSSSPVNRCAQIQQEQRKPFQQVFGFYRIYRHLRNLIALRSKPTASTGTRGSTLGRFPSPKTPFVAGFALPNEANDLARHRRLKSSLFRSDAAHRNTQSRHFSCRRAKTV